MYKKQAVQPLRIRPGESTVDHNPLIIREIIDCSKNVLYKDDLKSGICTKSPKNFVHMDGGSGFLYKSLLAGLACG